MTKRAVIYARLSQSHEESVSIARQVESCRALAAARGWEVTGVFTDDGVSATTSRPADRPGWAALLASTEPFDAVIIWKVDRLARRTLDFLLADQDLQRRGAGIIAVEDPIDMTTAQGRAFATMLAVFAEMEAAAISARSRAARSHLLRSGRLVGGTVPYGWKKVPNPHGPGFVLARDEERTPWVRGMVERASRGDSIYSIMVWLNDAGAPTPTGRGTWVYTSVERLLRNPVLAGLTPFNPSTGMLGAEQDSSRTRGPEVLRGPDGLPVVNPDVAVMPLAEWRAMVKALDDRATAQTTPRALRSKTSALLSGLVWCGMHLDDDGAGTRMHRGTTAGREAYSCPTCHQTISNLDPHVIRAFLVAKGPQTRWQAFERVPDDTTERAAAVEHRLDEIAGAVRAARGADRNALLAEQADLLGTLDHLLAGPTEAVYVERRPTDTFAAEWAAAGDDVRERRAVLDDALERVWVVRGRTGRGFDTSRLVFEWKDPEHVGPWMPDDDATEAAWADHDPAARRR